MAQTIREQIISAYVTRLAGIRTTSGYNIDAGSSVYRVEHEVNPDNLPAVVVFPQQEESTEQYNDNVCTMNIRCVVMSEFGSTNASVIQEQMLGDLKKCMLDSYVTVSYVDEISYSSGGPVDHGSDEDTVTAIFGQFKIVYHETIGNPYAQ